MRCEWLKIRKPLKCVLPNYLIFGMRWMVRDLLNTKNKIEFFNSIDFEIFETLIDDKFKMQNYQKMFLCFQHFANILRAFQSFDFNDDELNPSYHGNNWRVSFFSRIELNEYMRSVRRDGEHREMHWIREPTRIHRGDDKRNYDACEADIQQAESKCIIIYITKKSIIFLQTPPTSLISINFPENHLKENASLILRIEKKSLFISHNLKNEHKFSHWNQKKCTIF